MAKRCFKNPISCFQKSRKTRTRGHWPICPRKRKKRGDGRFQLGQLFRPSPAFAIVRKKKSTPPRPFDGVITLRNNLYPYRRLLLASSTPVRRRARLRENCFSAWRRSATLRVFSARPEVYTRTAAEARCSGDADARRISGCRVFMARPRTKFPTPKTRIRSSWFPRTAGLVEVDVDKTPTGELLPGPFTSPRFIFI